MKELNQQIAALAENLISHQNNPETTQCFLNILAWELGLLSRFGPEFWAEVENLRRQGLHVHLETDTKGVTRVFTGIQI